jgi:hypothetical protein
LDPGPGIRDGKTSDRDRIRNTGFKDKKSKRSDKTVQIKVFLKLFLLNDRRIRIRYQEAQKHVDPVDPDPDPDPQHWFQYSISSFPFLVEFKHGTLAEQFGACTYSLKICLIIYPY